MLYTAMSKEGKWQLPAEWDKVDDMFRRLDTMVYGYQLNLERKMFAIPAPEYRATLVKWDNSANPRKREVLVSTTDPTQMEAVLFMLINEAEQQFKEMQIRRS